MCEGVSYVCVWGGGGCGCSCECMTYLQNMTAAVAVVTMET